MSACGTCGHDNVHTAKFCVECGASMSAACRSCATLVTVGQKFCAECGEDLRGGAPPATPVPSPEGERKQVTVLFADLAGSMTLAEQFDPDQWAQIITGLFEAGAEAVRRYGGTVDKFTGDGLMALFGAPAAQGDHAVRAAHAGLALIAATRDYAVKAAAEYGIDLHVRVGLNSGEVVAGDVAESGFTAVGHTVGLAQRMESLADLDTVRLSEHTARLLGTGFACRDLGSVAVKGASAPVRTFALDGVAPGARRRSGTARLVGRNAEWKALIAALEAAAAGHGQVVGIVGEPGAGKSRLAEEIGRLATERGLLVRRTAGVSHATSAPLLPIRTLLADYFGIADSDSAAQVRAKIGDRVLELDPDLDESLPLIFDFLDVPDPERPAAPLGPEARRRRVLQVFRRITRRRSVQAGVVFVMEDLHWFDEHSVRFLDEWLPSFVGTRTLIVTNFRPEFRAPWVSRSYYRQIPLAALDPGSVRAMVADLVGTDPSLRALGEELADRAGGNPFFVEEIVRGWVEDGTLEGPPGAYTLGRPAETIRVPSSVYSVLAERIDRLGPGTKAVLQAAAVIGRTFPRPVLQAVAGADGLDAALAELCAAELLQETDEQEYQFWHPLTQEVAHNSLLGATRRRHHRAVAEALLALSPGRHDELAAVVASHFEAADAHLEAARWQIRAAHRATRTDIPDSLRLLRSALDHLAAVEDDVESLGLEVRARTLLIRVGGRGGMDPEEAEAHIDAARLAAERLGDPVTLTHVAMAIGVFRFFTGSHAGGLAAFEEAGRYADSTQDRDLQAWTHGAGCAAYPTAGPLPEGLSRVEQGRRLCAGDPSIGVVHAGYSVNDTLYFLSGAMDLVAGDLDTARMRLLEGVEVYRKRSVGDWRVWCLTLFAVLADLSGITSDLDFARDALPEVRRVSEETGSTLALVKARQATAVVALLDGEPHVAERALVQGLAAARRQRAGLVEEASMLTNLARAQLALGRNADARGSAEAAVASAVRGGGRVLECGAQVVRARILHLGGRDTAEAAAAAAERGATLARELGARTWHAFAREEAVRQHGGDWTEVAQGYAEIGAHGHARRIQGEVLS